MLHVALPATLEGYYQEIGRAGRDGLPSRTILMHSFADRKQHDFFFERDYPPVERLDTIFRVLGDDPIHREELPDLLRKQKLRLEPEELDKALEKLLIHGGATLDYEGFVVRGRDSWRAPYLAQSTHRGSQLERVVRFAESGECRMVQLVRHFGDTADDRNGCGLCDSCAPASSRTQTTRPLDDRERRLAHAIVAALSGSGYGGSSSKSTGKLHSELCAINSLTRDAFEDLLAALSCAGFLRLDEAAFEKDGRTIPYRKASLTHEGVTFSDRDADTVVIRELNASAGGDTAPKRSRKGATSGANIRDRARSGASAPPSARAAALEERLRAWRKSEAQKLGQPAFCVFADRTLQAIAEECPSSERDLLAIAGLGPAKVAKFGGDILRVCADA